MKRACFVCLFCLTTAFLLSQSNSVTSINQNAAVASPISASQAGQKAQAKILDSYGKLPLSFEANHGQADGRVKFLSRTGGYTLFLTGDEAVFAWSGKKARKTSPEILKPASLAVPSGTAKRAEGEPATGESAAGKPVVGESVVGKPAGGEPRFVSGYRFSDTASPGRLDAPLGAGQRPSTFSADPPVIATGGVLRMKLRKANPAAKVTGVDELAGTSNYFIGNDPAKWRTNVPTYAKVKYEGIYSGIDLVYYGNQRQLEYDFIVAPGADPRRIEFNIDGAKRIRRDEHGDLVLKMKMGGGEIRWHKPVVYQEKDGARQEIVARYAITDTNRVGFEVAKYDAGRPLYIDPLIYSTYLSGGGTWGNAIAVDSVGNTYVTGRTVSPNFPTTSGSFQQVCPSGTNDCGSAFVTKLNAQGSARVYSTYLGGSSGSGFPGDVGLGITVDSAGNAYVTGLAASIDFPTTPGAFQTTGGGAFVTKLNPSGSALLYSSGLGGGSTETSGFSIAVDAAGYAYVTGFTFARDFPTTPGAFQTVFSGGCCNAFVTKFNLTGTALVYSTFLGGSSQDYGEKGHGIAVDSAGSAYVTGHTDSTDFPTTPGAFKTTGTAGQAFVTKLSKDGSSLVYSTYLGGQFYGASGGGIAVDSAGDAYVTGLTWATDFPTTPGAIQTTCGGGGGYGCDDVFVTKLNPTGSGLVYSTFLGGSEHDFGTGIALDSSHNAYVIGSTDSLNFPTAHPLQPTGDGLGHANAFITKINSTGSALVYSTYLGSDVSSNYLGDTQPGLGPQGLGIVVDTSGHAYVVGTTGSAAFPTMKPLQPFLNVNPTLDAFVAKISVVPSDITLFPLHLNFSAQPIGVASGPGVSVLNNTGSTSLTITSISVTGTNSADFAQTNNCGASLQPATSCSITVTFTPTAIGKRSAAVKIVDSAPQQWVSLTGLGLMETVTTLSSSLNPSTYGQTVTFTAAVTSSLGAPPDGETVTFMKGTKVLGTGTLSGGSASFSTSALPGGANYITAVYGGDSTFAGSTSNVLKQVVKKVTTTTTLTSSQNPSSLGQSVTFTATVTPQSSGPVHGYVTFYDGTTALHKVLLSGGVAKYTTSALSSGTHTITATYNGNSNFIRSSASLTQTVN